MILGEGYTELRTLGSGASGTVVIARYEPTGQLIAVKRLAPQLVRDPAFVARFRAEAETLRRLRHPNIARLHWYVEREGVAALAMELVNGVSLRRMVEQGPATPEAALTVLRGSLLGLEHAHAAGIVHRDYKPENVVVEETGVSRLIDFGIAVPVGGVAGLAGTPRYMAPEQWLNGAASPGTDVYAATAVFFECLTGSRPYTGMTLTELRAQHLQSPIPAESVPEPLRGLVQRGLAKDPSQRFASAGAFLAELETAALAGYGPDWQERGAKALAAAALALAFLFPLGAGATTQTAGAVSNAVTELPSPPPPSEAVTSVARGAGQNLAGAGSRVSSWARVITRPLRWSRPFFTGAVTTAGLAAAGGVTTAALLTHGFGIGSSSPIPHGGVAGITAPAQATPTPAPTPLVAPVETPPPATPAPAPTATATPTPTPTPVATATPAANVGGGTVPVTAPLVTPTATFASTTVHFAPQIVGTRSTPQDITLSNSGPGDLHVASVSLAGGTAHLAVRSLSSVDSSRAFIIDADGCSGKAVATGATCSVGVVFAPPSTGDFTATLTFADNAAGGPQVVSLLGTATAPLATLPSGVDFGSVLTGTSAARTLTVANGGTADLHVTSVSAGPAGGAFAIASGSDACSGAVVKAGGSCTVGLAFSPVAGGPQSGAATVVDDAADSPQLVALTGTGTPAPGASVTPTSINFGSLGVGSVSPSNTVTLTNTGLADLHITDKSVAALAPSSTPAARAVLAAPAPKALILGDSVSTPEGGKSLEQQQAELDGFAVTVVSGTDWHNMAADQFAQYQVLIIGDPTCGGADSFAAAATNASVWEPVVMSSGGSKVLIGTDPTFHHFQHPGATALERGGIAFAGALAGATGAYVDLSCAYADAGPKTAVPILDGLSTHGPGSFTVSGAPCAGSIAIVAQSGPTGHLHDSDLSSWSCSVHEFFDTFPPDYSPLALATDPSVPAPYCANDVDTGKQACGSPYIMVSGSGVTVTSDLKLTPAKGTDRAGGTHTITAKLTIRKEPAVGKTVTFSIDSGPNVGLTQTTSTDSRGAATFSYDDKGGAGTDNISAIAIITEGGAIEKATATETWKHDFELVSDGCDTSKAAVVLHPNESCSFDVVFNPVVLGPVQGILTIHDDAASGAEQTVALSGTGVPPESLKAS